MYTLRTHEMSSGKHFLLSHTKDLELETVSLLSPFDAQVERTMTTGVYSLTGMILRRNTQSGFMGETWTAVSWSIVSRSFLLDADRLMLQKYVRCQIGVRWLSVYFWLLMHA